MRPVDTCRGMCQGMCPVMCRGMCPVMCPDMCRGMCPGMCPVICPGMCPGMCTDTCAAGRAGRARPALRCDRHAAIVSGTQVRFFFNISEHTDGGRRGPVADPMVPKDARPTETFPTLPFDWIWRSAYIVMAFVVMAYLFIARMGWRVGRSEIGWGGGFAASRDPNPCAWSMHMSIHMSMRMSLHMSMHMSRHMSMRMSMSMHMPCARPYACPCGHVHACLCP